MKKPEKPPLVEPGRFEADNAMELMAIQKWDSFLELVNNEYPYWEELKYKVKDWKIDAVRVWKMIKDSRAYHRQYIQPSRVKGFIFSFNIPTFLQRDLHELDINMAGILRGENLIPAEDKDRYLISSLMEEAIASSQIEGAVTTRKIAREILEKNKRPRNDSERMIVNNYQVMRWIIENNQEKLTTEALLKIHAILTHDTLKDKKDEGAFRDNDSVTVNEGVTNEVFYEPPSHKHLNQLIDDFCRFFNEEQSNVFIHPIVKGIILHFLIGYIHPFADGNGRTARAIFYWYLVQRGYWLVEYM